MTTPPFTDRELLAARLAVSLQDCARALKGFVSAWEAATLRHRAQWDRADRARYRRLEAAMAYVREVSE